MKAPAFWRPGQGRFAAALLTPAAWVYRGGVAIRSLIAPAAWRASVPVICVGNVTVGGSGKTPLALAIAARLAERGRAVHFLTRGYGGREKGPLRVDPARHTATDVGDEALLLAAAQPTWVGANRAASAKLAISASAEVLVMDDGLQNRSLVRDLAILTVDGGFGLGNGRILPAGPLREPLAAVLRRTDAVAIVGNDETGFRRLLPAHVPVLAARIAPGPEAAELAGQRAVAFAGIGRPDKFFDTLADIGVDLAERIAFPDHHPYRPNDLAMLRQRARQLDARLVTTEKDWVRLDPGDRGDVTRLTITLEWEDESSLAPLLSSLLDGLKHAG